MPAADQRAPCFSIPGRCPIGFQVPLIDSSPPAALPLTMGKLVLALLLLLGLAAAAPCPNATEVQEALRAAWRAFQPLDGAQDWRAALATSVAPELKRLVALGLWEAAEPELLEQHSPLMSGGGAAAAGAPPAAVLPPTLPCKLRLFALANACVALLRQKDSCGSIVILNDCWRTQLEMAASGLAALLRYAAERLPHADPSAAEVRGWVALAGCST